MATTVSSLNFLVEGTDEGRQPRISSWWVSLMEDTGVPSETAPDVGPFEAIWTELEMPLSALLLGQSSAAFKSPVNRHENKSFIYTNRRLDLDKPAH